MLIFWLLIFNNVCRLKRWKWIRIITCNCKTWNNITRCLSWIKMYCLWCNVERSYWCLQCKTIWVKINLVIIKFIIIIIYFLSSIENYNICKYKLNCWRICTNFVRFTRIKISSAVSISWRLYKIYIIWI